MDHRGFWKGVWRLKVPGVVKHFIWKVSNNILPTKVNLVKKKILEDPLCPICHCEPETIVHTLWSCRSSLSVWQEAPRRIQKLAIDVYDGRSLLQQLQHKLDEEEFEIAISLAHQLWLRRNNYVFEGKFEPPQQLVIQTLQTMELHRKVHDIVDPRDEGCPSAVGQRNEGKVWKKPRDGLVKLNWDASIDKASKKMGLGGLIRNSRGEVVAAFSSSIPYVQDPDAAETIALWKAILFCLDRGFQSVILEGDSLHVVEALRQEGRSWQRFGQLIEDSRLMLHSLSSFEVCHVSREANQAAHLLAKNALITMEDLVWMWDCPSFIQSLVLAEQDSSN